MISSTALQITVQNITAEKYFALFLTHIYFPFLCLLT